MFGSYFPDTPFRSETGPPPLNLLPSSHSAFFPVRKTIIARAIKFNVFHHPNAPDRTRARVQRKALLLMNRGKKGRKG
ncbi:hypothetical protein CEXT_798971, partial [Caerostris extrusa]